ncbi:sulfur carrier protein ThiS [Rhodococcus sp. H36-A4]|uniref:sulfur carrier protein ThiS n=1 Tax=unclassified Rhodococcus (in: high G+C Gram-positive bacteria) TaxID=192944 RepID=UPI0022B00276|nr:MULTISPECIES: sulfur carrier protein ThiS [unclassified Rhodococcus (in: high G+C Gram-positive bacteria)]MCZ4079131.1 sulfur carrier protein ThiS [Rhodococcus sp. H36-A4]MDJ0359081.1 sulfur carrier protein ThiS [Rhodococcus sp. H29-C3]
MTALAIGVTVNGEDHLLTEEMTMRQLLEHLSMPPKGIAVAVDGVVLPKSRWDSTTVSKGWTIDVLTAVQGG